MKKIFILVMVAYSLIACKPKKPTSNDLEQSDYAGRCSPNISLVKIDKEVSKEDLILKSIEVYLDEDTVNYFDIDFLPSNVETKADYAEFMVCGANKCLCRNEINLPVQVCARDSEQQVSKYTRSYLLEEKVRIPANFSGFITVTGRLCKDLGQKKSCGDLVKAEGKTKLSPLEIQEDEASQFALNERGKELLSLVDALSGELEEHSQASEQLSPLSFNLIQNRQKVKALLMHQKGALTYSTIGKVAEEQYRSNCGQSLGLVDGEPLPQLKRWEGRHILAVISSNHQTADLLKFSELSSSLEFFKARGEINLRDLTTYDGVIDTYNRLLVNAMSDQFNIKPENIIRENDIIIGFKDSSGDRFFHGVFNPNNGTLDLKKGYFPLGDESFDINDPEARDFRPGGKYQLDPFPLPEDGFQKVQRKVVVSGGGLAGLQSAINLIDDGHQVTLFEKYTEFDRNNVLIIDEDRLNTLKKTIGEDNFESLRKSGVIANGKADKRYISINDYQRILLSALEARREKYPDRVKTEFGSKLVFTKVGADSSEVTPLVARNGTFRQFTENPDFIVGADSSKSAVGEAANIERANVGNKTFAFTAVFELKDSVKDSILSQLDEEPDTRNTGIVLEKDPNRPWTDDVIKFKVEPKVGGLFATKSQAYFYGELTEQEYEEYKGLDAEGKKTWIMEKQVIPNVNPSTRINSNNFTDFFDINRFNAAGFPIDVTRASSTVGEIKTANGIIPIALLGDAGATTNFFTGTGANRAIESAVLSLMKSAFPPIN